MHNPLSILSEPAMMHAAVVHFPIVFAVMGVPVVLAALFFQKNMSLRVLAIILFGLAVVSSYVAEETGEGARSLLSNTLPVNIWDQIDEHEELGSLMKYTNAFAFVALVLSMINFKSWRGIMLLLATCGAIATSVLAAGTAHLGGTLVYEHGIGTPYSHGETPSGEAEGDVSVVPTEEEAVKLVPILDIDMASAEQISFTNDVKPLINTYCIDCHEGSEPDGAYDMSTYEGLLKAGEKAGPGVIPGDPDNSSLVQYVRGEFQPRMPKREPPLPVEELHVFRMWIAAGAKNDSPEQMQEVDPFGAAGGAAPEEEQTEEAAFDPFG
jgi:uncharacterized membrane protein